MTKQGSTAHGCLKITDSGLECIPFTSTGITLFVSHQPYRSLSQQLSCTQLQAYSPFHFLWKGYYVITKFIAACTQSNPSVLGVFCIKIRLNYSANTYKQDPLEFLLQQALLCNRILLCHRIAKARFHLQCFLDVSYVAHAHVFLVSLYFSQTFPEFLWGSPLGPFWSSVRCSLLDLIFSSVQNARKITMLWDTSFWRISRIVIGSCMWT